MSWFFLALIPPALWAATNHIDKVLITKHFRDNRAGAMVIFSSLLCLIILPFILIYHPEALNMPFTHALILILKGALGIIGFFLYAKALANEDASVIAPLFELTPIFTYFLAYLILGETLANNQIEAFFIILFGAILISLDLDQRIKLKAQVLFCLILACIIYAISSVIFKNYALIHTYWPAMFWSFAGVAISGTALYLFSKPFRDDFLSTFKKDGRHTLSLNLFNESLNYIAIFLSNYCILLAPIALVSIVGSFQSVFVFIFGIILTLFLPHINQESLVKKHLVQRIVAIAIILLGSYLLNVS